MTAALRKTPDSTNGSPPYDALTYQRNVNSEVIALWQASTTRLIGVAGTNDITATSDAALVAAIPSYAQPMSFWFTPVNTNTGGMTINIDSVGVINLKDATGATLVNGAIVAGTTYLILYDGTQFRVVGSASSASAVNSAPDMILRDEKTTGTHGGTFTSGSFVQRTLNTVVRNVIPGASLSASQFTLQAGTYLIQWEAPAVSVQLHQSRLFNATDAVTVETGTSAITAAATSVVSHSRGIAVVTITSAKTFEIDHICGTTAATSGAGQATNLAAKEVYTTVYVWKVGSLPSQVNGVVGGAVTWPVLFDTSTVDADPGAGKLRLNNATQNAATQTFVDLSDANGTDITAVIDSFNGTGGQCRLVKYDDPTKWIMFSITGWTTATGYRKLALAIVGQSSASPFANGDRLYFAYTQNGSANTFANPSVTVGLTTKNGTALTAPRSDSAPALDQSIAPTWTSLHTFNAAVAFNNTVTHTVANALALAVGLNGATNPAFQVDTSTALQAAGLKITGAVTGGTVAIAAIDSGSNANLSINAKGTGTIAIGSVSSGTVTVTPALNGSSSILSTSPSAGVGYAVGAGGSVTQITSKSTAVTLNKISGQVALAAGVALASNTAVTFNVNNTAVAINDVVIVNPLSSSFATSGTYLITVDRVGSGFFTISVKNISGGSLTEAVVISFAVIKAVIT